MLFGPADIPKAQLSAGDAPLIPGMHAAGDARFLVGTRGVDLHQLVGELRPAEHVHLVSVGSWSFHELITYCLRHTGPADLSFTTWTVTEAPMRVLAGMRRSGAITHLQGILDSRVEKYNSSGYQLAREVLDKLRLVHIHCKCAVITNAEHGIHIQSTANLTRNRRIEMFTISTHCHVAEHHRSWITSLIDERSA